MKGGVCGVKGSVTSEGRGLEVEGGLCLVKGGVCGVEGSVTSEQRGLQVEGVYV